MEYILDNTCLEDSLVQPADPTQADTAAVLESALQSTADTHRDGSDEPTSTGALAALVKVGAAPALDRYSSHHFEAFWPWLQGSFEMRIQAESEG